MSSAGYSGTPLGKKLGYRGAVWAVGMPQSVREEIEQVADINWQREPVAGLNAAHGYFSLRAAMAQFLQRARAAIAQSGMIWVSWPKRAAKVATDITEDVIREEAFRLGLVDIKVCAVDDIWSGLKLVIRKDLRDAAA
jgi:hypothetical protein